MQVIWHKAEEAPKANGFYWVIMPWMVDPNEYENIDQMLEEPITFITATYKDGTWAADSPVKLFKIEIAYWAEMLSRYTVGDFLQEVGEDITGGII